jgi:hypothetical protein
MPRQGDPNWGRSKLQATGLEILITILSLCALVWAMAESVNYARELGRPLGFAGFLELWFREAALVVLAAVFALTLLCVRLWRLLHRFFSGPRRLDDPPGGES